MIITRKEDGKYKVYVGQIYMLFKYNLTIGRLVERMEWVVIVGFGGIVALGLGLGLGLGHGLGLVAL